MTMHQDDVPWPELPDAGSYMTPHPTRAAAFFIAGLSMFVGLCFGMAIGFFWQMEWIVQ